MIDLPRPSTIRKAIEAHKRGYGDIPYMANMKYGTTAAYTGAMQSMFKEHSHRLKTLELALEEAENRRQDNGN